MFRNDRYLECDGPGGLCPIRWTIPNAQLVNDARQRAERKGWKSVRIARRVRDFCPEHARQRDAELSVLVRAGA